MSRGIFATAVAAVALMAFPFVFTLPFPQHLMIMIFLYAALGQAWNLLGGYAGQVSLGHVVYFGVGAYTSGMLEARLGLTPWLGMVAGGVLAVAVALVIGAICFRLQGHYFVIATLAIGEIFQTLAINWPAIGGATGLSLPIKEGLLHLQFAHKTGYYFVALGLAVLAFWAARGLERSRAGYYFRAIKADPAAARSLGIDVTRYKLLALVVSAFLTALGGSFIAHYVLYIDPFSVLSTHISVLIALMAVLGGTGTPWGPALGALVLIPLSEYTRIWFSGSGRAIDLMIYGALIVLIALYQPAGLVGLVRRRPGGPGRLGRRLA